MYPELFRIGDFPVTSYGLWLAVGLLFALFVASRLAANDGLRASGSTISACGRLLGGLIGSKVLMFFVEDSVHVFSLDFLRSGGVYYCGLIGGFSCRRDTRPVL
jgi:prolipoprotein diacylglyceryltransferase